MGLNVYLCASVYPEREKTVKRVGIDVTDSIDAFVKAIGRNEILPFLGVYQRLAYSYFFFKKLVKEYKVDFVVVTGGSGIIPAQAAKKTIVYVHFPADLEFSHRRYLNSWFKRLYIKPAKFISYNLDDIKTATIVTNSNYTKNLIFKTWNVESTVIYPPCPQYSFPLDQKMNDNKNNNTICSLGRFTPEKEYETILEIARKIPTKRFELVGSVTPDKIYYLDRLQKMAPNNVIFHVNASIEEKMDVLLRSRALLHSFIGEHFGIAIIEAMSAGLIPVTHNSGAAKDDRLVPEKFRYADVDGAVSCLDLALNQWSIYEADKMRAFALQFSPEAFRNRFKVFISHWRAQMQAKQDEKL
jgi:glycosyltransferase involved in cell wall biosynthesis